MLPAELSLSAAERGCADSSARTAVTTTTAASSPSSLQGSLAALHSQSPAWCSSQRPSEEPSQYPRDESMPKGVTCVNVAAAGGFRGLQLGALFGFFSYMHSWVNEDVVLAANAQGTKLHAPRRLRGVRAIGKCSVTGTVAFALFSGCSCIASRAVEAWKKAT